MFSFQVLFCCFFLTCQLCKLSLGSEESNKARCVLSPLIKILLSSFRMILLLMHKPKEAPVRFLVATLILEGEEGLNQVGKVDKEDA